MAQHFSPTHEITLTDKRDGSRETIPVQLDNGYAYTKEEWDHELQADWERDSEGFWTYQGKAAPSDHVTVSVRITTP